MSDLSEKKPKRNDHCPCNSGKKYKECHIPRKFNPDESFELKLSDLDIDYHFESIDGGQTLIKAPGVAPDEIQMRVHIRPVDSNVEDVGKLIAPLSRAIPENRLILRNRVSKLSHKLQGVKYHINNFARSEESEMAKISAEPQNANGVDLLVEEPKLLYEVEGFLFQSKSSLDVLAQLIAMVFNLGTINRYSDGGEKLVKPLEQNAEKSLKPISAEVIKIIRRYGQWAREITDMRDDVTHFSDLEGFSCFIVHAYRGGGLVKVSYPAMPDGIRAVKYMKQAWMTLCQLISEMIPVLVKAIVTESTSRNRPK